MVFTNHKEWAIIHACQEYHYKLMGWNRVHNKPNKDNEHYLIYEYKNEMSLNWVDGGPHLYDWYGPSKFSYILDYIETKLKEGKKVFIHCRCGRSRSPTLGLLYLAKRLGKISNSSFSEAYMGFIKIYPQYNPGGISKYVEDNWCLIK